MSISWTASTNDSGATCFVQAYSGPAASDLLILAIGNKYPGTASPTLPAGWTHGFTSCGGIGLAGVDSGSVQATIFYKVADGTEGTGNQTTDLPSGNCGVSTLLGYRATTGSYALAFTQGYVYTPSTTWTACGISDPGVTGGDTILVLSTTNNNTYTYSAQSITQAGITFDVDTERGEPSTSEGDDLKNVVTDHTVSSGTSSGCPIFTMTVSGSAASQSGGVSILVRIREVTLSGNTPGKLQPMGIIY